MDSHLNPFPTPYTPRPKPQERILDPSFQGAKRPTQGTSIPLAQSILKCNSTCGPTWPYSRRDCVQSPRSIYTGLYPQSSPDPPTPEPDIWIPEPGARNPDLEAFPRCEDREAQQVRQVLDLTISVFGFRVMVVPYTRNPGAETQNPASKSEAKRGSPRVARGRPETRTPSTLIPEPCTLRLKPRSQQVKRLNPWPRHAYIQTDRQTDRHTYRQIGR